MVENAVNITQTSTLPPAQPVYVLRGHSAQIHSVHFLRHNLRLLSGDADGWVVLWSVPIKRPVAVWKAHQGTILGLRGWDDDKIITHGRDHKLCVWHLREEDEAGLSTVLPIDDGIMERKMPWLLHSLPVHALNFCSFAVCRAAPSTHAQKKILVAVPGLQDGQIHVTSLPGEERVAAIPAPKDIKAGMVMAIGLHHHQDRLLVLAGYESGDTCVWTQHPSTQQWHVAYHQKAHKQPVLSLDVAPTQGYFYTSSADAVVAQHPLVDGSTGAKTTQTKHSGQQSLTVRQDERIFATAGWDGRVRVYSAKSMKELAVLRWHKEGCYALAFATTDDDASSGSQPSQSLVQQNLPVSEQRTRKASSTHWLAAGSKDGKVSLWDIY